MFAMSEIIRKTTMSSNALYYLSNPIGNRHTIIVIARISILLREMTNVHAKHATTIVRRGLLPDVESIHSVQSIKHQLVREENLEVDLE